MRFVQVTAKLLFAVFVAGALVQAPARAEGDAGKGKIAFVKHGCWQCHDYAGEGSIATSNGKVLARTTLPFEAFQAFVRSTNGAMPPYRAAILSDGDLADIYAYLQSLPQPKAARDIPLLGSVRTQ